MQIGEVYPMEEKFIGNNVLWSGELIFQNDDNQVNERFTLYYNGKSPEDIGIIKIVYTKPNGSYFAIRELDPSTKQIVLTSGGKYVFPNKDSVIRVSVSWNNESQNFNLHYMK